MVCRIAEAFRGECWILDSFEEKERFIQRGQLAFGAPRRAGSGPGVRVSFRLDAGESNRLKLFIGDLDERGDHAGLFSVERDEFRADAAVEFQVALFLNDAAVEVGPSPTSGDDPRRRVPHLILGKDCCVWGGAAASLRGASCPGGCEPACGLCST